MLRRILVFAGSLVLVSGAFASSDKENSSPLGSSRPVKYEAEEGSPKDKKGEKRRDYAVLEAALEDLVSPNNPEYRYYIRTFGPSREIVVDHKTVVEHQTHDYGLRFYLNLAGEIRDIDYEDPQKIPADVQKDFERRKGGAVISLVDFKPANPNILVRDLNKLFEGSNDEMVTFTNNYPTAWGHVRTFSPGYSGDGKSALVVFYGGPGRHGHAWVYMLVKKGKRWEVGWRHLIPFK